MRSIELKEELRRTAEGTQCRRDYLASQIWSYKGLAACRVRLGPFFTDAFDAVELASARYLAEQLGGEDAGTESPNAGAYNRPVRLDDYRSTLPKETAILNFANTDYWYPICLLATDDSVYGAEREQEKLKKTIIEPFLTEIEMFAPKFWKSWAGCASVSGRGLA